jgi:hypothetical protein
VVDHEREHLCEHLQRSPRRLSAARERDLREYPRHHVAGDTVHELLSEIDFLRSRTAIDGLLHDFRQLAFSGIKRALEIDGACKSYEGAVELHVGLPNYFKETTGEDWGLAAFFGGAAHNYKLTLHCYVLGPARHYDWEGSDVQDVFARATADVRTWIAELEDGQEEAEEDEPSEAARRCDGCRHWSRHKGTIGLVANGREPMYLTSLCRRKPRRKDASRRTRESDTCEKWEARDV